MTSKAVNRPVDPKVKEKDINQKLQLFGVYSAFANGKVPSNKQIDVALNSAIAHTSLSSPSKKISPEGQNLIADLRNVIEQAKVLALTKNSGNLLQDFIWHSQQIGKGQTSVPGAPVDKTTAQQHGNEAAQGFRTLGTLLITNGQFRKLLNDAVILARAVAGDAASNAASRVQPSEDQLNQLDHPADDNTWHDAPNLSRDNIRNQAKSQFNKQKPVGAADLQDAANDADRTAAQKQQAGADGQLAGQSGATDAAGTLKERASANVPEDTKNRGREAVDRTKNYLGEKLPKERREQTIWRLKKMVVEVQGHQDYQRAIETLLNLAETYGGHATNVSSQAGGTVKGAHADDHLRTAEADLMTLIERFANSTSSDDLFDSINTIYRDADKDPELKNFFKDLSAYVRKALKEEGFIMQDAANEEWNRLYDRGNFLLRERYRDHTNRILDEFKFLGDQFDQDPQNKQFAQSIQKLFNDLGNDEAGKPAFKPHLIKDLTNVILPAIFENVSYVPVPRIEYSDKMVDAVIENLVIESDNLTPNVFEFGSDNYVRWGRKQIGNKFSSKTLISVSGIQMDLRDVSYYIKKKEGFPAVTDKGVADIFLGGQGLSFKIKMATAEKKDRNHFFKIEKIDVDVKNIKVKLKQSNHKLLFNIFKPLLFQVIRPVLQKVLEKQIRESVTKADGIAWEIHQDVQRTAKAAQTPEDKAKNLYSRYYTSAQKRILQGKEKSEAAAADKKVNVAVTQEDSIFKNIKLPGGISTKATEYKQTAASGDKWESPIFSIGSAKESTNLPSVPSVQRKSHSTAKGGVRGEQNVGNTSSFTNEVNQSFGGQQTDLSLGQGGPGNTGNTGNTGTTGTTGTSGSTGAPGNTGTSGTTGTTTNGVDNTKGGTTLGANNPIVSGQA
ncbi:MAG: hypothetical protein M1833_006528 [Piccolia ochrophora]|nr:MAG: hypothetical protein M1833_006528 [Piccolia ochrophora]